MGEKGRLCGPGALKGVSWMAPGAFKTTWQPTHSVPTGPLPLRTSGKFLMFFLLEYFESHCFPPSLLFSSVEHLCFFLLSAPFAPTMSLTTLLIFS